MTEIISRAAVCDALIGPNGVTLQKQRLAPLMPGQIRVRLKAAALNFPDLLMTYGKYQFRPALPFVLGMEGAGIIEEVTDISGAFRPGDAVLVKNKTGIFAEFMIASEAQIEPMPRNLSFEEAAAFTVTYLTAHVSLVDKAQIKPGETLLVLGAGGGVGQAAVTLGKAVGAVVIAVASSPKKLAIAYASGADYLIDYSKQDFTKAVQEITQGKGADVILDPVGGRFFEESLHCIAWYGRLLIVGFASGEFGVLKTDLPVARGCTVIGVRAGEFGRRDPAAGRRTMKNLRQLAEEKDLKPFIGKRWPFHRVAEALRAMENRNVAGKQVILIEE